MYVSLLTAQLDVPIPPSHKKRRDIQVFQKGFHRTPQPDKDCVIHSEHSPTSWTSSFHTSHFKTCLTSRFFQVVTRAVNHCDIQLLLQCLPSPKCLTGAWQVTPTFHWLDILAWSREQVLESGVGRWAHLTGIMTWRSSKTCMCTCSVLT